MCVNRAKQSTFFMDLFLPLSSDNKRGSATLVKSGAGRSDRFYLTDEGGSITNESFWVFFFLRQFYCAHAAKATS